MLHVKICFITKGILLEQLKAESLHVITPMMLTGLSQVGLGDYNSNFWWKVLLFFLQCIIEVTHCLPH